LDRLVSVRGPHLEGGNDVQRLGTRGGGKKKWDLGSSRLDWRVGKKAIQARVRRILRP